MNLVVYKNHLTIDLQMLYFIFVNLIILSIFIMQIIICSRKSKNKILSKKDISIQTEQELRKDINIQTEQKLRKDISIQTEQELRKDISIQTEQELRKEVDKKNCEGIFKPFRSNYPNGIEYGYYYLDRMKCKCWRINGKIVKEKKSLFTENTKRLFTLEQKQWYDNSENR